MHRDLASPASLSVPPTDHFFSDCKKFEESLTVLKYGMQLLKSDWNLEIWNISFYMHTNVKKSLFTLGNLLH